MFDSSERMEPGNTGGELRFPHQTRRVLMLTHRAPFPPDRGDRIRSYHLLRELGKHFRVSLASVNDEPLHLHQMRTLREHAEQVLVHPISNAWSRCRGLAAMMAGGAVTPTAFYRDPLAQTISGWHDAEPFDAVLTFCTGMVRYARLITDPARRPAPGEAPPPPVRHVLDLVDVDSVKWEEYARRARGPMKWVYAAEARRLREIETGKHDGFDAITVISDAEAAVYREQVGDHPSLHVVGNGVDLAYFQPLPDAPGRTLTFVGVLNYKPNVDAVTWFARQVMPLLRRRLADATFRIVGKHAGPDVRDLGKLDGVEVVGAVPDVREELAKATAVVAPLRVARGVQNKVLEAMASARATIVSPAAAEGLDAEPGRHFALAHGPQEWVSEATRLLSLGNSRRSLAERARRHVEATYHWQARLAPMVDLLRSGDVRDAELPEHRAA